MFEGSYLYLAQSQNLAGAGALFIMVSLNSFEDPLVRRHCMSLHCLVFDSRFVTALQSTIFCGSVRIWYSYWPQFEHVLFQFGVAVFIIPPATKFRGGILDSPCSSVRLSVRLSVCPSVCLSVRPSVRPWVGVRMINLILFSGFKFFFLHISLGSTSCMGLNISVLPH